MNYTDLTYLTKSKLTAQNLTEAMNVTTDSGYDKSCDLRHVWVVDLIGKKTIAGKTLYCKQIPTWAEIETNGDYEMVLQEMIEERTYRTLKELKDAIDFDQKRFK